jgi:hypothetical protein
LARIAGFVSVECDWVLRHRLPSAEGGFVGASPPSSPTPPSSSASSSGMVDGFGQGQSSDLPLGWEEKIDPDNGRKYYVNHASQTTQWNRPTGGAGRSDVTRVDPNAPESDPRFPALPSGQPFDLLHSRPALSEPAQGYSNALGNAPLAPPAAPTYQSTSASSSVYPSIVPPSPTHNSGGDTPPPPPPPPQESSSIQVNSSSPGGGGVGNFMSGLASFAPEANQRVVRFRYALSPRLWILLPGPDNRTGTAGSAWEVLERR